MVIGFWGVPRNRLRNSNEKVLHLFHQRGKTLQYNPPIFRVNPQWLTRMIRFQLEQLRKIMLPKNMTQIRRRQRPVLGRDLGLELLLLSGLVLEDLVAGFLVVKGVVCGLEVRGVFVIVVVGRHGPVLPGSFGGFPCTVYHWLVCAE
jgi:hypothetical protein